MERIITVTGDAVANPRNFRVPIGMSYQELLDIAGGFKQEPEKIICGGPMMGFGMFQLDVPTTKTSTALLALTQDDVSAMDPVLHQSRTLRGSMSRTYCSQPFGNLCGAF